MVCLLQMRPLDSCEGVSCVGDAVQMGVGDVAADGADRGCGECSLYRLTETEGEIC